MLDTTQRASVAVPVTGHAFVARQPIFDSQKRVYGYELLFRNSEQSVICDAADGSAATSAVIAGTLFELGHADVLGGNRGFYNFTRDHLLRDNSRILDPRRTVIEVLESVAPDDEVVAACIRLKAHGFSLALDDFDPNGPSSPLVRFADIIKVDFRETDPAVQRQLAGRFGPRGVTMLAEKVETSIEFALARSWGYSLFQGYFFARPELVEGRKVPGSKARYHQLLCALNRKDLDFGTIESAIKNDVSLTYKFLQYLNSVRFGFLSPIKSVRHALVLLGEQQVRTFISLAIVASMGSDQPPELIRTGAIRSHFCELLGNGLHLEGCSENLFLMGLLSVLDAVMGIPLAEVLTGLYVDPDVPDSLLGNPPRPENRIAPVYSLVLAYEMGNWSTVAKLAQDLGAEPGSLPGMYAEAIQRASGIVPE